jgi:hypothetical protein
MEQLAPLLSSPPAGRLAKGPCANAGNLNKGAFAMLKAVLRQGVIVPLEPLPPEWEEGVALEVAKAHAEPVDIDAWAKSMTQLCEDSSRDDEEVMRRAIEEHRQQAKAQVRREMGLPA